MAENYKEIPASSVDNASPIRIPSDLTLEFHRQAAENKDQALIAGVDEVGRGPLAGPVVAAAVILDVEIPGVTDSKKLTPLMRRKLAEQIKEKARCFAYGRAEVEEIDRLNIHHATLLAMKRAIESLSCLPNVVLVDGKFIPLVSMPCQAIIGGDLLIHSISAASILAKVLRDDEMIEMDKFYPGYGFAEHKGYPTAMHRQALQLLKPCAIHRRSYAPVKSIVHTSYCSQ